ncbi:MAG: MaoC family dehydratase [Pseudomonadota bacterium]
MSVIYLEDLEVGLERSRATVVTRDTIEAFGAVSGDRNPVHFDDDYAKGTMFGGVIAHGMICAGFISALIAGELPGEGTIYLKQSLAFRAPVRPGDEVTTSCKVAAVDLVKGRVTLDCTCVVDGKVVLEGEAVVLAPKRPAAA